MSLDLDIQEHGFKHVPDTGADPVTPVTTPRLRGDDRCHRW